MVVAVFYETTLHAAQSLSISISATWLKRRSGNLEPFSSYRTIYITIALTALLNRPSQSASKEFLFFTFYSQLCDLLKAATAISCTMV